MGAKSPDELGSKAKRVRVAPTMEAAEMAQVSGLSLNGVYSGLARGEIPGRRVGRRWVVSRRRFLQWLHGGTDE